MQLEERMILSFIYGAHHYLVCDVVMTRETLWHLCGYGVSPVDRYLDDLVNIILVDCIHIIESVDSISRDERDVPLTQYITNA